MVPQRLARFFQEARRRSLFAVLAFYCVGAWIVLQGSDMLFPGWDIPESAIRYVWIGAILLFPVAATVGWLYDLSAKGIYRTSSSAVLDAGLPLARPDFILLSILSIMSLGVVSGVAFEVIGLRDQTDHVEQIRIPKNSIAVLPFVNMSDDEANEYFSDGITEQLLNELARLPDLHVAARTSAFYYKDKEEALHTMGETLGVRTLLEGSVRKFGNRLRITAQLINAADGYHLWSATYDRDVDDLFAIQDDIARSIANTLKIELLQTNDADLVRYETENVEAYDLYLRAMATRMAFGDDSLERSNELLQRAIELDPEFSMAIDALAYGYLLMPYSAKMEADKAIELAEPLLARALELQPDLEQAHASLGQMRSMQKRFDESNLHFEMALSINPNYFGGLVNYGLNLVLQGRLKEGNANYIKAQALDPLNANLAYNLGAQMMLMGQYDAGLHFMKRSQEIDSRRVLTGGSIAHWMTVYGQIADAIPFGQQVLDDYPDYLNGRVALIRAYVYLGMFDEARERLDEVMEMAHGAFQVREVATLLWLRSGDFASIDEFVNENFRQLDKRIGDPLNIEEQFRARDYARALLRRGDAEQAADILYWAVGGEDGIESTTYDYMLILKLLGMSYTELGFIEEANSLLDRCLNLALAARDNGWATPNIFVRIAEIYAVKGDVENTVTYLTMAFERGWRDLGNLEYSIFWRDYQDVPAINEIKIKIYNDMEMQREELQSRLLETA